MFRKLTLLVLVATVLLGGTAIALAQDEQAVSGLNNPRHLFVDVDGTIYVAEAGSGGTEEAQGPYGPVKVGTTGQITAVTPEGEQTVVIGELVSMDAGFGQIEGPMALHVTEESYWLVLGMRPQELAEGQYAAALVEINRETLEVVQAIDFAAYENEHNPDEDVEQISNPADIAVSEDGIIYIADASANTLLTWTEAAGINLFAVWPVPDDGPSSVPTSVQIGPDGDIYVGFLSGFPFPTEGARIERFNPEGELQETYEGLTLVTDILVAEDGTIYAVEFASGFGDQGYIPESGRVVTVTSEGLTPVAEGLNFPYGIAQAADGSLYVSVNAYGQEPGSGAVIVLGM